MLLPGIVRRLFENEDSPRRFEDVSRELVSDAEGIVLATTSPSWDLGRDARDIVPASSGPTTVLLASLQERIDQKIHADVARLTATTKATTIYYCSSQTLTEHACDGLATEIKQQHPTVRMVSVLGQHQLASLVDTSEREAIIRRHYGAEIKNIEDALLYDPSATTDPERLGLRLALITQTGDDARELRAQLARRLVLENLFALGAPQRADVLAQAISKQLHLTRPISADYIRAISPTLIEQGLVTAGIDDHLTLTTTGTASAATAPNIEEASARLLEGREAIREALERLSGHRLLDEQYDSLWETLQDELSRVFYTQGTSILRMIDSLLRGHVSDYAPDLMLSELAATVGRQFHETQRDDITTAIVDMFSDKESNAFKWLTDISSSYVMMCTLGLEDLSAREVESVVENLNLVADSDLILSLLCEREDNHDEVERILRGWRALGGKLIVAIPVLEEVAYHAWISNFTYSQLEDHLASISETGASSQIDNAFVRSFRRLSAKDLGRRMWGTYIAQYRGSRSHDYGNILDILRDEFNFSVLPSPGETHKNFEVNVFRFLRKVASEEFHCESDELGNKVNDKCRRDAQLLASVLAARRRAHEAGLRITTLIVSSARRLKDADREFRTDFGTPEAVLSTAAVACLLMLTPGSRMSLATLRQVLFDLSLARRFTPLQHFAFRIISRSNEFNLPISRRVALQKELRERVLSDARHRDEPAPSVMRRLVTVQDPEYSAAVVADALDAIAIRSEGAQAMRQEIRALTNELQAERAKLRPNSGSQRRLAAAKKATALKTLKSKANRGAK